MSKNPVLYKSLVVGVIVLFVGLGIQPAFAVEPKLSANNTEKVEDCDCQSNDKTHLVEKLLNRLEKNEVLYDVIDLNKSNFERPICEFLSNLIDKCLALMEYNQNPFILQFMCYFIAVFSGLIFVGLLCFGPP